MYRDNYVVSNSLQHAQYIYSQLYSVLHARAHTSTWRYRKHTILKYFKGSLVIEDSLFLDLELGHKVNNFEQVVNRF